MQDQSVRVRIVDRPVSMIFFADVSKSVTGKTNVGWVEINSRFKVSCSYVMIIEVPTLDLKINYIFNNCK